MYIQATITTLDDRKRYKTSTMDFKDGKHLESYISWLATRGIKCTQIEAKNMPDEAEQLLIDALELEHLQGAIKEKAEKFLKLHNLI